MSAAAVTIVVFAIIGAVNFGLAFGFVLGRHASRQLVVAQDELVDALEREVEVLQSQYTSIKSLVEAQDANADDHERMVSALIAQRNRFAQLAGFKVIEA